MRQEYYTDANGRKLLIQGGLAYDLKTGQPIYGPTVEEAQPKVGPYSVVNGNAALPYDSVAGPNGEKVYTLNGHAVYDNSAGQTVNYYSNKPFNVATGQNIQEQKAPVAPAPAPSAPQSRNDSRESGGIKQQGTNMGGGLAAFDLSAAESWLGGPMRDPFNSSPLPGSPDSMHQYAALDDESNALGGFGDNVEVKFRSNVNPGAYSEFNAAEGLVRTDIPQDIFPVDLKNTELKPAAQTEEGESSGYKPDLARRAAFLDAKDSMSGMKAVNRHMGTVVNAGNHYIRKGDELVGISRDQYRDYMRGDVGAQALLKDTVKAVVDGGAESPASRTQIPNFPQNDTGFETPDLKGKIDMQSEDFTRSNILPGEMDPFTTPDMSPIDTNTNYFG